MTNQKINFRDIVPSYQTDAIPVQTEADLLNFGKANLAYLRLYWQERSQELAEGMEATQADLNLLADKTPDDIRTLASAYEFPEFPLIGIPDGSWFHVPEPLDQASIDRKPGATNFNCCGWCEHHGGGIGRYDYAITSSCMLIPEEQKEFPFNMPCVIANGSQKFLDACVAHLEARRASILAQQEQAEIYIDYLAQLMDMAGEKPPFAPCRPEDWFRTGDRVVLYIPNDGKVIPEKAHTFISGTITKRDERHVTVCTDRPYHTSSYCGGCGGDCGIFNPGLLTNWDFYYLKGNPDYLDLWLQVAQIEYGFKDGDEFRQSLLGSRIDPWGLRANA